MNIGFMPFHTMMSRHGRALSTVAKFMGNEFTTAEVATLFFQHHLVRIGLISREDVVKRHLLQAAHETVVG